jgi:arginase family enzyme
MRHGSEHTMKQDHVAFVQFRGRAGDRNPFGMTGAALLGTALSKHFDVAPWIIGSPQAPLDNHDWTRELAEAHAQLKELADAYEKILMSARAPITAMGRCACALATLPVVGRLSHDAKIVWFDAHGDLNTPLTSSSGYLGGMVLAGAAGLWETGLGSGLDLSKVVLVGARDLDPAEQELIESGTVQHVAPGSDLLTRLSDAVGNSPVYIHIDCDVLNPGVVPTEFSVPHGLSAEELRNACELLAENEIVGLEVAEFQSVWSDSGVEASPQPIVAAVAPVIEKAIRH